MNGSGWLILNTCAHETRFSLHVLRFHGCRIRSTIVESTCHPVQSCDKQTKSHDGYSTGASPEWIRGRKIMNSHLRSFRSYDSSVWLSLSPTIYIHQTDVAFHFVVNVVDTWKTRSHDRHSQYFRWMRDEVAVWRRNDNQMNSVRCWFIFSEYRKKMRSRQKKCRNLIWHF